MEKIHYTDEKNILLLLSLMKKRNIRKVITSPGSTNHTLVKSMQNDPWFELYSSVDERSAAYMACGLCAESGESVVITCTEATASRNYMPGLTEAYYRKLPILALTTSHGRSNVGNLIAQVIDHSVIPNDVAVYHNYLPSIYSAKDYKASELIANEAFNALNRRGGGPVYLTVESVASRDYSVTELPDVRDIACFDGHGIWPEFPKQGRVGVFVGAHLEWSKKSRETLDLFCEKTGAVVFCDHTSGYYGKYKVNYSLVGSQEMYRSELSKLRLLISIGEVSGDYFSGVLGGAAKEVWRVNEDGRLADKWGNLSRVFEMPEEFFFQHYANYIEANSSEPHPIEQYIEERKLVESHIPDLPYSKVWVAQQLIGNLPSPSYIHFSILGSLRAGNFFDLPEGVKSCCNVGGFGIDGATSTLVGASLAFADRLHFLLTGDLAFFYDLNAIGNRHIGPNIRILLINNGDGTEFRQYWHPISVFTKDEADEYMAAGGHFGNQSRSLVKNMAQSLGFDYLSASNKDDFQSQLEAFLQPSIGERSVIFEVFTDSEEDSRSVKIMRNLLKDEDYAKRAFKKKVKELVKDVVGNEAAEMVKLMIKR